MLDDQQQNIKFDSQAPNMGVFLMQEGLGWVAIPRCIQDEVFYTDSNYIHLFIHIVLNMNKKDKMHNGIIIKKNQFKTGRLSLSENTGIQESKISRILKKLQELGYIEQQTTNKYRIITVVYDAIVNIFEQQATTGEQQRTTGEQLVTSGDTTNITTGIKDKGNNIKEMNKPFLDNVLAFHETVENFKCSTVKINKDKWCTELRILEKEFGHDRVIAVLGWYDFNIGKKFVPECFSMISFREKFEKLEAAIKRGVK